MFKYLTYILILLTLFSCKKEEVIVIEEPWECLPCGAYQGLYSGNVQIPLSGTDTTFYNLQAMIDVSEGLNDSINVSFDFSNALGAPSGTAIITIEQAYWSDSTIHGEGYLSYAAPNYMTLDATCSNSFNDLHGEIVITGYAVGEFTFNVTQQ